MTTSELLQELDRLKSTMVSVATGGPRIDTVWPAPGSEDTELGVLMELEVGHGETEVYAGVQA
jgi:hypothetical protein